MRKLFLVLLILCLSGNILHQQVIFSEPLSGRLTGYSIDVKLDTGTKTLTGEMETFWVNSSQDIVPDVRMHLYMNAFRSSKTTFNKGRREPSSVSRTDYGWININAISTRSGTDLLPFMDFISPDDGNPDDSTVVAITLPQPAFPGDSVFLQITFETKLPATIRRTGYTKDFCFVAQWFPKFGVYEPAGMRYAATGAWNCHQFHPNSEFYSNHSVYDVSITLPKQYVVGSGGIALSEKDAGDDLKTVYCRAEDIVDFAWTAWPGYAVFKDKWEHVEITLLIPGTRIDQVDRQFTAVKYALRYLTDNVGPYPWPHLTVVDPPSFGAGAGGMEYTTLFTSASAYKMPSWIHLPEMVTIHEFGHAYFMGIIASNEFEEPWLDEGVNSFWEVRIVDHYYGKNSGLIDNPHLKVSDAAVSRIGYTTSPVKQLVSNNESAWNYPRGSYSIMSYNKAATWLLTLMGIVGEETMNEIFREYYRLWAFRHPSGKDFVDVVNKVVARIHGDRFGSDMNWFFEQALYGTAVCDYKVAGIRNTSEPESDGFYKSVADIERVGEMMLPVEVLIRFDDGDEITEFWDGKSRFVSFQYTGPRKIESVKIDPEFKIRMDINFVNNSMTIEPDLVPVRRMAGRLMIVIQFLISIISL
ncbi:MAG: M1 family metallopeptidase [Bacteroidales bacterium]|nr:M1 family metallopeptidase [Bacteroidales bacterium]